MRKFIVAGTLVLALASTAAIARPGGGPGAGIGAGPPITPPGQMGGGMNTSNHAQDIASQRGQFGRDFADQQRLTSDQYRAQAAQHRADALALAQAARSGAPIPANAAGRIRMALQQDIQAWRDQFTVGRKDWQAMRDQWLADRGGMTAQDWAQRRADWFAARDAWVATQKTWASSRRN